ncbi:MAG: flagellar hook-basal body complex protein FliE [Methanophagales archaeon ANME-1-THS]|nr:MAG: flagellar hook-basal body complex protein FliE [Methanophagales archaeon ANME-1-THS]
MADGATQVLAFVGAPAAGKTEAASVAREMGVPVITMGDVIRDELRRRGLSLNDENAGRIAHELRAHEGMDAIAKRCIPRIRRVEATGAQRAKKKVIVIDGIRGIAEVERFKTEFGTDFVLIRIDAPLGLRYERITRRRRGDDLLSLEGFKEREERENRWGMREAMEKADKVVKNEGSLDEFKDAIKKILTDI